MDFVGTEEKWILNGSSWYQKNRIIANGIESLEKNGGYAFTAGVFFGFGAIWASTCPLQGANEL